jgi:hypothetical protein
MQTIRVCAWIYRPLLDLSVDGREIRRSDMRMIKSFLLQRVVVSQYPKSKVSEKYNLQTGVFKMIYHSTLDTLDHIKNSILVLRNFLL